MGQSATLTIKEACGELRRQGRQVFDFGLGQSPFPVPTRVVEALRLAAPEKDYLPVEGLWALREAVAGFHRQHDQLDAHADREPDRHASVHGHSGADIHTDREPDADGNAYEYADRGASYARAAAHDYSCANHRGADRDRDAHGYADRDNHGRADRGPCFRHKLACAHSDRDCDGGGSSAGLRPTNRGLCQCDACAHRTRR